MFVTKIEPCGKTRFKIYLDESFAFVLYKGEAARFGIRLGEEISEETVQKIREEVIYKRARKRALHLLEDMDRTETELQEKLRQGLYPPDAVENAVSYVKSFGYLDDARYAEHFAASRSGSKSKKEIRALLARKGVSAEMIDRALETGYGEDGEAEAIRQILKKKRVDPATADPAQLQKIYGYLGRKGFSYEAVRQVIQNCCENA